MEFYEVHFFSQMDTFIQTLISYTGNTNSHQCDSVYFLFGLKRKERNASL